MFEHLAAYRNVIVTGAHRSGTTICAKMIAADTGKRFVIERDLATPRFEGDMEPRLTSETVQQWLAANPDTVLQGATCFRWLIELQRADRAIVFVWREPRDVIASQHRYRGRQLDVPAQKLRAFREMALANAEIVQYDDLAEHPLFHADRTGWGPRQIAPDDCHVRHG